MNRQGTESGGSCSLTSAGTEAKGTERIRAYAARYDFHFELKTISDRIRQAADQAFAEYDLTGPQAGFIHYIKLAGGTISQKELEQKSRVSHPTVVGIVCRMQEKGYLAVTTDPKDHRKRIITLTQKAEDVSARLSEGSTELNERLVTGLSPAEQKELYRMLGIIDRNLVEVQQKKAFPGQRQEAAAGPERKPQ